MKHSQLSHWFRVVMAIGLGLIGAVLGSPLLIRLMQ